MIELCCGEEWGGCYGGEGVLGGNLRDIFI